MKKTNKIIILALALVVLLGGCTKVLEEQKEVSSEVIKIGVITDLTGGAAYWGESTRVGAEIALEELKNDGYNVKFIYEDYRLDAKEALSAAQKLVNFDKVQGIYSEFNPAAISVGSFTKDLEILHLYEAAVTSLLKNAPNTYKTYLDYQSGCKEIAKKFKEQGIEKIGMLKVNLEFGEICLAGVKEIYNDNIISEAYNLGDNDFKTQVLKMKNAEVGAIINTGFEGDTLNTLKAIRELKFNVPYGTVDDTVTDNVKQNYKEELKGTWTFGFTDINLSFLVKIENKFPNKNLSSEYGAAFAYIHLRQMVKAIDKCGDDYACIAREMDSSKEVSRLFRNVIV